MGGSPYTRKRNLATTQRALPAPLFGRRFAPVCRAPGGRGERKSGRAGTSTPALPGPLLHGAIRYARSTWPPKPAPPFAVGQPPRREETPSPPGLLRETRWSASRKESRRRSACLPCMSRHCCGIWIWHWPIRSFWLRNRTGDTSPCAIASSPRSSRLPPEEKRPFWNQEVCFRHPAQHD